MVIDVADPYGRVQTCQLIIEHFGTPLPWWPINIRASCGINGSSNGTKYNQLSESHPKASAGTFAEGFDVTLGSRTYQMYGLRGESLLHLGHILQARGRLQSKEVYAASLFETARVRVS